MSKKLFCLALVLMMVVSTAALAEALPSRTVESSWSAGQPATSGAQPAPDFAISPALTESEEATTVYTDILTYVNTSAAPVAEFFGADVVTAIAALVPDVETADLELTDFFPMTLANYDASYGDVTVPFTSLIPYEAGSTVVALLGIIAEDGTVTWLPLAAEVNAEGQVVVTFTAEALALVGDSEIVLAFLEA